MEDIETNRFTLSKISLADAENVYNILTNENVINNLNIDNQKNIEDTKSLINDYLNGYNNKTKYPYKIIDKNTGDFVGVFINKLDLYDDDCFEFTVFITENYWNKGVYSEILPYMIDSTFKLTNFNNYRGFVKEPNIASRKVLEKYNFELEKIFKVPGIEENIYSYLMKKDRWKTIKNGL